MTNDRRSARLLALMALLAAGPLVLRAQQYNSDSWISKPEGTITIIPTIGQRNMMLMNTFSLVNRWEFTVAAYLYNDDGDPSTNDGYSASLFAKYMFWQRKDGQGGGAIKAGTGMFPGVLPPEERVRDAFRTYWMNMPFTFPLFNYKVSLDLMPGASVSRQFGAEGVSAGAFTYSTRVAWYCFSPQLGVVGETYGSVGTAGSEPEYKIGLRWEPDIYTTFALTYGARLDGAPGAGLEFGVMLFTPPFACLGGCK
jgi:hypothetical protein